MLGLFRLAFEFIDSDNVPLDLVVNDLDRSVSDLIAEQELVELSVVAISLENVQKIQ